MRACDFNIHTGKIWEMKGRQRTVLKSEKKRVKNGGERDRSSVLLKMKVYIWTHTRTHTRAHTHTYTHRMRPAESVWLTVLSEPRTLWGGKGRGGGGTEQRRGWIGKGWRSIRREAEVSGVSERRSRGFGEAGKRQLLLLQQLCVALRVHVQECVWVCVCVCVCVCVFVSVSLPWQLCRTLLEDYLPHNLYAEQNGHCSMECSCY